MQINHPYSPSPCTALTSPSTSCEAFRLRSRNHAVLPEMLHGNLLGVDFNERQLGTMDDGFFPMESKDRAYFTLLNGAEKTAALRCRHSDNHLSHFAILS